MKESTTQRILTASKPLIKELLKRNARQAKKNPTLKKSVPDIIHEALLNEVSRQNGGGNAGAQK